MSKQTKRKRGPVFWTIMICVLLAAAFGLNTVRIEAGGIHNMFSRAYWEARLSGRDLYAPDQMVLKHGSRDHKEIALTIDDGPHPQSIGRILDILKREDVHATFFVVGIKVQESPQFVKRMIEDGNEVGNHTVHHPRLTTLKPDQMRAELEGCEQIVEKATGHRMTCMRPPGMQFNPDVLEVCKSLGYTTVNWTNAAKDFVATNSAHVSVPELESRVMDHLENGSIILLHDAPETADALEDLIGKLKKEGYRFVTVSQMLAHLPKPVIVEANPLKK